MLEIFAKFSIRVLIILHTSQALSLGRSLSSAQFRQDSVSEDLCAGRNPGTFISNPKACEKFYFCNLNAEPISVYCPEGMWFNSEKGICDLPEHVSCFIEEAETSPQPTEEVPCPMKDSREVVFIGSKLNCSRYYLCYHGIAVEQECIRGLHWNEDTNKCDYPEKTNCQATSLLPRCPPTGQKLYPHPKECNYFIYCVNGHSSLQQCPFYHHWDARSESCLWKNVAHCVSKNKN